MTDKAKICSSLSKIAYGYILILVAVMIGTVDILPDFVGYIMMLYAIDALKDECKTITLLKPFGYVLAIWKFAFFILNAFGLQSVSFTEFEPASLFIYVIYVLSIIINIVVIYFDFQLLTEMSLLAKKYQAEGSNLDKTFIIRRNIYTVCMTSAFLISNITNAFQDMPEDFRTILIIVPAALSLFVMFLVVSALFSLRKTIRNSPDDETDEIICE